MNKLVGAFLAILVGLIFVFFFPNSNIEGTIIPVISSILSYWGIKSWRDDYAIAKAWFQSRTLLGSLMVVVPVIILATAPYWIPLLHWAAMPEWLNYILGGFITIGGGTVIWGIFKAEPKETKIITNK